MQRTRAREFARLIDGHPVLLPKHAEIFESLGLAVESFGPAEKAGRLLYWNFQRQDGRRGFTVHTDVRGDSLFVSSDRLGAEFYGWVLDALAAASNGDRPPAFVGAVSES